MPIDELADTIADAGLMNTKAPYIRLDTAISKGLPIAAPHFQSGQHLRRYKERCQRTPSLVSIYVYTKSGVSVLTARPGASDILRRLHAETGSTSLDFLKSKPRDEIFEYLSAFRCVAPPSSSVLDTTCSCHWLLTTPSVLCLHVCGARTHRGLGPKTINCIGLYCLGTSDFPVDTHVFRIAIRYGDSTFLFRQLCFSAFLDTVETVRSACFIILFCFVLNAAVATAGAGWVPVYEFETARKQAAGTRAGALPEDLLPAGWAEHFDNEGTPYYHHEAADKTQWDRPVIMMRAPAVSQGPDLAATSAVAQSSTKYADRHTPADIMQSAAAHCPLNVPAVAAGPAGQNAVDDGSESEDYDDEAAAADVAAFRALPSYGIDTTGRVRTGHNVSLRAPTDTSAGFGGHSTPTAGICVPQSGGVSLAHAVQQPAVDQRPAAAAQRELWPTTAAKEAAMPAAAAASTSIPDIEDAFTEK